MRIESTPQQGGRVARTVALADVVAIFVPFDPAHPEIGSWIYRDITAGGVNAANFAAAGHVAAGKTLGVVYVPENAPVLIEAAVGAAESENFATSLMMYTGCNG